MGVSDSGSRATGVRENSEQLPGKGFREITGVWHHGATSRWIGRTHTFQFPLLPVLFLSDGIYVNIYTLVYMLGLQNLEISKWYICEHIYHFVVEKGNGARGRGWVRCGGARGSERKGGERVGARGKGEKGALS